MKLPAEPTLARWNEKLQEKSSIPFQFLLTTSPSKPQQFTSQRSLAEAWYSLGLAGSISYLAKLYWTPPSREKPPGSRSSRAVPPRRLEVAVRSAGISES